MKELTVRVLVALVGIPIFIFAVLKGGIYFFVLITTVALAGQTEMMALLKQKNAIGQLVPALLLGFFSLFAVQFGLGRWVVISILTLLLIIFAREMFLNKGSAVLNVAATMVSVVYPVLFLAPLLFLRVQIGHLLPAGQPNGAGFYILTLIVAVWGCDTFAYFFGKQFGRHRLFERVSPKKSIEGAVAGLIGAVFVFFLAAWLNLLILPLSLKLASGVLVGTFGQLGDLVESWFKRDAGVKDSSNTLPGHGGFLDRFDSLAFITPALMILFLLLA